MKHDQSYNTVLCEWVGILIVLTRHKTTYFDYMLLCLLILFFQINDSWKRIADTMGIPVHELKKKKDNLLGTFRTNLKKRNASIRSGAGTEDVYQPIWIFYDVMAAFLTDVYESTSILNSEEKVSKNKTFFIFGLFIYLGSQQNIYCYILILNL